MVKALIPEENSTTKKQHKKVTKTFDYTTIVDLHVIRTVGVTTVIQLVRLNRLTGTQPSH